jgi:hypothetical protein
VPVLVDDVRIIPRRRHAGAREELAYMHESARVL